MRAMTTNFAHAAALVNSSNERPESISEEDAKNEFDDSVSAPSKTRSKPTIALVNQRRSQNSLLTSFAEDEEDNSDDSE